MFREIFTTSASELRPLNKQWIIGDRMPRDKFPELHSHKTQVKYSLHQPNDPETGQRTDISSSPNSTLVVLLSGAIEHTFYEEDKKTIKDQTKLNKEGEMVYYGPNINHTWKVTEPDTKVLTIQFVSSPQNSD